MEQTPKEDLKAPINTDRESTEFTTQLLPQRIIDIQQQRSQEPAATQNTVSLLTEQSSDLLQLEMKIKEENEIKAYYAVDFLGVRHRVIDHYIPQVIIELDTWITLLFQAAYIPGDTHQTRNLRNNLLLTIRFFSVLLSSSLASLSLRNLFARVRRHSRLHLQNSRPRYRRKYLTPEMVGCRSYRHLPHDHDRKALLLPEQTLPKGWWSENPES